MKQKYSEAFIEQAVVKLLSRGKRTVREVALDLNINYYTANDGQSPIQQVNAANDVAFTPGALRAEAIPWLGELHHSYRRAA